MAIKFFNDVAVDSDVLYVDTANNEVGINTNNPAAVLHVTRSSGSVPLFQVDDTGDKYFQVLPDSNTTFLIGDLDALGGGIYIKGEFSNIQFIQDGNELIRIKDNGNVGIGATNPDRKLVIEGGGFSMFADGGTSTDIFSVVTHQYTFSDENEDAVYSYNGTDGHEFSTGGSPRVNIKQTGKVGVGTTNPHGLLSSQQGQQTGNVFTNPNLALQSSTAADGGFCGMTFAASSAVNYGYSVGAHRTSAAHSDFEINYHYNDAAGTNRFIIDQTGDVGIGTASPSQKLDVNGTIRTNSAILIDATLPTITLNDPSGAGEIYESAGSMVFKTGLGGPTVPIVMQLKADGALQHGNSSATGQYAAAFGQNNTASSLDAFATGENNISSGRQSFTAGFENTASGAASFAVGGGTTASGENAFAACGTTVASGISSAAFGAFSEATATNAFAINGDTLASGESSFSLGVTSTAQGLASIASGLTCTTGVSASGAFAGGTVSQANGTFSMAYGNVCTTSGTSSQAFGYLCRAEASASYGFAANFNNVVYGSASAAFGQQNSTTNNALRSFVSGFMSTVNDSASGSFGAYNGMQTASQASEGTFMMGRYLNVPRDINGNPSPGCLVVGQHNAYSGRRNVKFAVGTGVGVGAEQDSFTVLSDGNVLMEQIVNKNYTSDSAAAAGGVPVGGIYHNAGDLKIRLT